MKKVWKVFSIIGATIVWLVVLMIIFVFVGSNWAKTAAEDVIAQMHAGQIQEVYQASALAELMEYDQFSTVMGVGTEMDITQAELISWNGRGFEDGEKYIYGKFLMWNWSEQYLTFWFVEDDGEFILLGITGWTPDDLQ